MTPEEFAALVHEYHAALGRYRRNGDNGSLADARRLGKLVEQYLRAARTVFPTDRGRPHSEGS